MSQSGDQDAAMAADVILFVTGDSPRSIRARSNLASALQRIGDAKISVHHIDLLEQPERISEYGIFATPALIHARESGEAAVLYGDLSNELALQRFLSNLGRNVSA